MMYHPSHAVQRSRIFGRPCLLVCSIDKVAELIRVGNASDALNVAQPTLSRQIRALELELEAHLFARNARGVTLTVLGMRFLEHARGIVHAADTAVDALNRFNSFAAFSR